MTPIAVQKAITTDGNFIEKLETPKVNIIKC
jgi:hypothetical protein